MDQRALLVSLLLAGPILSGCVGALGFDAETPAPLDGLSEPVFGMLPGESVRVAASSDGTELQNRLFLPDTSGEPGWKAPTILVMSPYFGPESREDPDDEASPPAYFRYQWLLDHFVPRGYAVVFSDVRGTGESGGCLEQTASLQRQDGYDLVEWLAAQDWSNGKVGMFGKSYDAETQQGTAILAPPHLTTIVPVASVSGQYEWNFYDGVPFTLHTLFGNYGYMVGDGLEPPSSEEGWLAFPSRAGCHPVMLGQAAHRDGDWDAYWDDRELRNGVGEIEAAVLYVHGLQDWNVRQVALRDWYDRIPSEKRALFGQWAHDYPEENRVHEAWSRTDWRETVHKWYDHFLLGLDNGILGELPPVQVQDDQGAWRVEATYPPTDTIPFELHLAPDRLETHRVGTLETPLLFRENEEAFLRGQGLPVPSADTGEVQEALVFTSDPMTAEVRFAGWPSLELDVLLFDGLYPDPDTETDAHFAVNLFKVGPEGEETWLNAGYLSARHRDGVRSPAPVPEDEVLTYHLRFHPGDSVLPEGSSLKLVLSGSDRWTEPEGTLWGAELHRGVLRLPTIVRDLDVVGFDAPMGEPCSDVVC